MLFFKRLIEFGGLYKVVTMYVANVWLVQEILFTSGTDEYKLLLGSFLAIFVLGHVMFALHVYSDIHPKIIEGISMVLLVGVIGFGLTQFLLSTALTAQENFSAIEEELEDF